MHYLCYNEYVNEIVIRRITGSFPLIIMYYHCMCYGIIVAMATFYLETLDIQSQIFATMIASSNRNIFMEM